MFNNSPFSSSNIDQLQYQYQSQLDAINRMKEAGTDNPLVDIGNELSSIGKEELNSLYETEEYKGAKSIYEAGFLQFISNKFSNEYVSTKEGKEAALNLLKVIKSSKDKIAYLAKAKAEKIDKILELLENDPEMKRRYDELITGSNKKNSKKQ